MLKTNRHLPQFDSLEGKILLSAGMADPAATRHHETVKPFVMTGSLSGLPNGLPGRCWIYRDVLSVTGHLASMGTVNGSFSLANPFIPVGKLPDLGGMRR